MIENDSVDAGNDDITNDRLIFKIHHTLPTFLNVRSVL